MNKKYLSYKELIALAFDHYCEGGDGVYECWDEQTFNEYVKEFGQMTEKSALNMFRLYNEVRNEYLSIR